MKNLYTKAKWTVLTLLAMFGFVFPASAVDYYSQGTDDFHTLLNWNTLPGGGGASPAAILATDNFFIQNGDVITVATGNAISINNLSITDGSLIGDDNLTLAGDLTVAATELINMNANTLTIGGVLTNAGTVNFSVATVHYNGVGAQTVFATTYGALELSGGAKTAGTGIVDVETTFTHNADFDLGSQKLELGGAISGTGTNNFSIGTVEYNATGAQDVITGLYNNIIISSTGIKTATGALDVDGDFTINDATTFADGGFTHNVAGNWTENDASAQMTGTGTIVFDGGANSLISSSAGTVDFYNLTLLGAGTVFEHTAQVLIAGDVLINDGTTINQNGSRILMSGMVWEELGTGAVIGDDQVRFSSAGTVIRGDSPVNFNILVVAALADITLEQNIEIVGNLLINNGVFDAATFTTTGGAGFFDD